MAGKTVTESHLEEPPLSASVRATRTPTENYQRVRPLWVDVPLCGPRSFNARHRRAGHLFQNRFKNILVEEESYLLELVRYIHLNPVRSRLPVTIDSLDRYPWTGHAVLLGHQTFPAQDTDFALSQFGRTAKDARRAYRQFVLDGATSGKIPDLDAGGLRRSAGRWEFVGKLRRGREKWACDERILGSSDFVREVLCRVQPEDPPCPPGHPAMTLTALCQQVALASSNQLGQLGPTSPNPIPTSPNPIQSCLSIFPPRQGAARDKVGRMWARGGFPPGSARGSSHARFSRSSKHC
jgi:hypothetical protein